jgi:hypothetical protein
MNAYNICKEFYGNNELMNLKDFGMVKDGVDDMLLDPYYDTFETISIIDNGICEGICNKNTMDVKDEMMDVKDEMMDVKDEMMDVKDHFFIGVEHKFDEDFKLRIFESIPMEDEVDEALNLRIFQNIRIEDEDDDNNSLGLSEMISFENIIMDLMPIDVTDEIMHIQHNLTEVLDFGKMENMNMTLEEEGDDDNLYVHNVSDIDVKFCEEYRKRKSKYYREVVRKRLNFKEKKITVPSLKRIAERRQRNENGTFIKLKKKV